MNPWRASIRLRGLRVQILLWTILPLTILLIGFSLTGIHSHQDSMRALVAGRDAGLAQTLAGRVAAALERYTTALRLLAAADAVHRNDPDRAEAALAEAGRELEGMTLLILDASGRVVAGPAPAEAAALSVASLQPHLTRREVIAAAGAAGTLIWSIPLQAGGWLVGALGVEALALGEWVEAGRLGASTSVLLVDQGGQALFAAGGVGAPDAPADIPGVAAALAGGRGVAFAPDPGGEQVVAYAPVAGAGWALVLREPWEALADPLLRFDRIVPFVLLTAAVVSLLALYFGLRYVVRPLQKLDAQTTRIGQGDFEAAAAPVGGVEEIETLRRTLDRMARELRRYQDTLQDYLGAITQAQEEERARLARELHDETVQTLVALGQRAQMVQRTVERDPARAAERLAELRALIGEAVQEVRRFSRALRQVYLEELGLAPALETLARETGASFQWRGSAYRLSPEQEVTLYRIAQEALNNALRHAQASRIGVELTFADEAITLQVWDDGVGFTVPNQFHRLSRNGHFGLLGMHERAQAAGGRLTIASAPGRGTTVTVTLPAPPHTPASANPP